MSLFSNSKDLKAMVAALDKSQAVIEFDIDGTILTANANFLNALGYTLDEIKGRHHRMFVDPAYAESAEYKAFWDKLRRGEYDAAEYKRLGKGGREVWIQASYNPILGVNGKPYKVIKYATDITAAVMKNADYQGQIAAIGKSQAVIEFNMDGTIVWANQNFLNVMGYTLDEIKGRHHSMFAEPAYANSPAYKAFWEKLRRGEYEAAEYKRLGKGGREVWIEASYNPILDPNGKPFKVVKYATDVTAKVLARQEAERTGAIVNQNLERIVDTVATVGEKSVAALTASTETLSTVQTVAAAAEELNSSIQEIAQSMSISKNAVDQVIEQTEQAGKSTQLLSENANAMSGIVDLIENIASQINLLALNATIESARAGEAGKGFAVVASEVKNLANQVANATSKITSEIQNIQVTSNDVVTALGTIKTSINDVQTSVSGTASAVEEQNAVTREISSSMQLAASSVNDINSNIQMMSHSVEDANSFAVQGRDLYRKLQAVT